LFIDIVGYSKLLINQQSEQLETLKKIVRGTEQFRIAEAEGKLLRLPTGDGGALVFRTDPEAAVRCALEIGKELKSHPELRVRMGIHSGPVNEVSDLNEQANIAGAGINLAKRVMDCGDAGHILLSRHVAEDLEHYGHWQPLLHDLGECEVKHGMRLDVVNLYNDGVGNPQVPKKVQAVQQRKRIRWVAAALLLLAALALTFFIIMRKPLPLAAGVPEKSIAVLPFENLSRDPENAYFAAGIQDEIITRLSKIADLRVISCTSTQRFRTASDDIPAIGRQLGVANVVEGSVQRITDQFRVNVQLVEVTTNAHLWADTFDRERKDIFVVESEIAKTIAERLKAKLTGREQEAITAHATDNPIAHQLYLKGRYFWNKRSREDMIKALVCFQQAAQQDPNYPLAYVGIADTYNLMPLYDAGVPRDCQPKAEAAARKALELDNSSAEAHASLSLCFFTSLDFDQSLGEFEKSIQLNPNYATAHHWLAFVFLATSQVDRAIAECRRALELDPLSFIINSDLGTFYYYARRYDEAIDQFRKTIEIDPAFNHAHWSLGKALEMKGDLEPAMKEYQKARELSDDPWIVGLLAHAYAASGNKIEAQKYLKQLQETARERYVEAQTFALVYLGLGNKDEAIRWLEQAYQGRAGREVFFMKSEPLFDPLRGDPRFQAVVKKVLSHRGQ
jgi:TolB-like protein/Tfp pilus assembly protein PilF